MRFAVEISAGEDGWVIASCPSLPGCHTQGATREDALVNIQEAILAWLEAGAMEAEELFRKNGTEVTSVEALLCC